MADSASGLEHVLSANQELDCIPAGLGLRQRHVRGAVDRMSVGFHRFDYWGIQVLAVQLCLPGMLAAATDRLVLGDMLLKNLAGEDRSFVADSLAEVLLLHILELSN